MANTGIKLDPYGVFLEGEPSPTVTEPSGITVYRLVVSIGDTGGSENGAAVFPAVMTSTDRSGTITTGGIAQNFAAANSVRKGWTLCNLDVVTMYVNDTGAAASASVGIAVAPGQTVDDGGKPSGATLSVFSTNTGGIYAAKEYT